MGEALTKLAMTTQKKMARGQWQGVAGIVDGVDIGTGFKRHPMKWVAHFDNLEFRAQGRWEEEVQGQGSTFVIPKPKPNNEAAIFERGSTLPLRRRWRKRRSETLTLAWMKSVEKRSPRGPICSASFFVFKICLGIIGVHQ